MRRYDRKKKRCENQVEIEFTNKAITAWGSLAAILSGFLNRIRFREWVENSLTLIEKSNNAGGVCEKIRALFLTVLEKKLILFLVKRFSRKLKVWAELSSASYQAKYLLVAAETAVATGRFQEAATLYHRAVQAGREQKYANWEALANERAAVFYQGLGRDEVRRVYLKVAYLAYSRWGAILKARELLLSAPTLLTQTDRTVPAGDTQTKTEQTASGANTPALDLSTVMQASQAISRARLCWTVCCRRS